VFFNQIEARRLSHAGSVARGRSALCLLSHGVDSSDYLHETRIRATLQNASRFHAGTLAGSAPSFSRRWSSIVTAMSLLPL